MATAVAFDTHKAVQVLQDAGFEKAQAAAITNQIAVAVGNNVATKSDLELLNKDVTGEVQRRHAELDGEMEKLRTELRGEMEKLRTELRGEMEKLRTELKGEMAQHRAEIKAEMKSMEMRIYTALATVVGLLKALDFLVG